MGPVIGQPNATHKNFTKAVYRYRISISDIDNYAKGCPLTSCLEKCYAPATKIGGSAFGGNPPPSQAPILCLGEGVDFEAFYVEGGVLPYYNLASVSILQK